MIDVHSALRTFLIAASPLRTLLGGNYVYWPEVPDNAGMPRKAISFRISGGLTSPYLHFQEARVSFRCWGSTSFEAMTVYDALHDRLHGRQNFLVGNVGFHGAEEDIPGEPLEEPVTTWPFVFTVYTVRVATVPIT